MGLVRSAHPILAIILFVGYGYLAFQLFRRKQEKLFPIDHFVTQFVRITFLLAYLSGLILSMNLHVWVHKWHHYTSLAPVAVMFIFQFLPQLLQKEINVRGYAFMFLAMFISVVIISFTSGVIQF